jgi:hypothetical protein
MAFTNSFTGKGTGILLPSGEGLQRSQEKMSDMMISAERLKYDTFKKNEAEFEKNANIDPVFSLSKAAMETQSGMLNQFNQHWGKVMQQKGGNLSEIDKTNMAIHKNYILMEQGKMKSDMDRMQQDMTLLDKDYLNRYDREEWYNTHYRPFAEGKSYNPDPLPIKSQDFVEWARTMAQKDKTETFDTTVHNKDGSTTIITRNIPLEQAPARIKQYVLAASPSAAKNLIKERFINAPDKQKYIDASDNQNNAIIAWAQNQPDIIQAVVNEQRQTKLAPKSSSGGDGNMRTWQGQKYTPTSAMESPFPSLPTKTYHPITNLSKQLTIPIANMELLEPDKAIAGVEKPNQSIKGFVTGYDESTNKITFLISQDYKDLDYPTLASGKGMQIAVPRSAFSKEIFDDLEIIKDGKLIKLKDLATSTQAPVKKKLY